jgi:hypothetical protein
MSNYIIDDRAKIWKPSVNLLVKHYHDSLKSLVNVFDATRIPWRDDDQFDSFDGIAESLYYWIVIHRLENYIRDKFNISPTIAKYNFFYKDYSKIGFLEVDLGSDDVLGQEVFNRFGTKAEPFDMVVCDRIDHSGNVIKRGLEYEFDKIKFRYQHRKVNGELSVYEKLVVEP